MKTLCKDAIGEDNCPKGLNICCYTCEDHKDCKQGCVCFVTDYKDCDAYEEIHDELIQFKSAVPETIQQITQIVKMKKQLDEQEKQLKEELVKAMEAYDVKSFENDVIKMTYVAPTTRSTIDSTRLKKDHPDIAEAYTKVSNVSASVRVTVK